MIPEISVLNEHLSGILQREWPASNVQASFEPLVDLSAGDLASDVPLRLAREFKCGVEAVAPALVSNWSTQFEGQLQSDRGFLNLRMQYSWSDLLSIEPSAPVSDLRERSIYLPALHARDALGAYLRLGCRALLQQSLLNFFGIKAPIRLLTTGEELYGADMLSRIRNFLLDWSTREPILGTVQRGAIEDLLVSKEGAPRFLWILPATLRRAEFQSLFLRGEQHPSFFIRNTDAGWAQFPLDIKAAQELTSHSDERLRSEILLLAGNNPGIDLDLAIAQFEEKANLSWYIRATRDRLSRFTMAESMDVEVEIHRLYQILGKRSRYFLSFLSQAAFDGRVSELMTVLLDILDSANRLCNDPAFRCRVEAGNLGHSEVQILAGVSKLLSDIIPIRCF